MKSKITKLFLIIPIILVLVSVIIDSYSKEISQIIKIIALLWILASNLIFNRNFIFFSLTIVVAAFILFLGMYRQIELMQLIESGIRYLTPIIVITYGFQLKIYRKTVLIILLTFVLLNNFYQLFNWLIASFFNDNIGFKIKRAVGFVGYFDFFGFINIIGLFIINQKETLKLKKSLFLLLSSVFSIFLLWSLSLKMIVIYLIYVLFFNRKLLLFTLPVLPFVFVYKDRLISAVTLRLNRYVIKPQSARSESYRVLFEYFNDFLIIGQGPGTFGGPASSKYESVLYDKYNFKWFGEQAMSTTDTYYPHLFVELGIPFGLLYLFFILILPLISIQKNYTSVLIIFTISINSVFSFALNSLSYCIFSFMLIFILSNVKFELENKKIISAISERFGIKNN